MNLAFSIANPGDAPALTALHLAAAADLTERYGRGHWSSPGTEKGVLGRIHTTRVLVARDGDEIVATLELVTKKPWAIDRAYFTPVERSLYLINMAVMPARQRQGIGRRCMREAERIAHNWPVQSIRLDAYDAAAGAGEFYARCGYREVGRKVYRGTPLIYYEHLLHAPEGDAPRATG